MRVALGLIILALPLLAVADSVVPVDEVGTYVKIRKLPDPASDVVGRLHKSKPRPLVNAISGWHEVELDDGTTGFVSSDWSVVITEGEPVAAEETAAADEAESEAEVAETVVEPTQPEEPATVVDDEAVKSAAKVEEPEPEPEVTA